MIYLSQACLGCQKKNHFPFNSIFLVGRTLLLPIFYPKSAVEVFIWSFTYIFDKIVIEIRRVEEKK